MKQYLYLIFIIIFFRSFLYAQTYKIIESDETHLVISFDFTDKFTLREIAADGRHFTQILGEEYSLRKPGEPWLPTSYISFGIPFNSNPTVKVLQIEQAKYSQKFILPYPDSSNQRSDELKYDESIYATDVFYPHYPSEIVSFFVMRYARAAAFNVYPYQFNPVSRELLFNKKILIRIDFNAYPEDGITLENINDPMTEDFISTSVINPSEARNFIAKVKNTLESNTQDTAWYNPQKQYYKIYLNKKGVYRVTYEQLIAAGISPFGSIQQGRLELINNGRQVPIDIVDVNQNGLFDSSDYFQFIGFPPSPTTSYTYYNIYNLTNVYWFSYNADSVYQYKFIDGYPPIIDIAIRSVVETEHYEVDKIYEPLGYAPDDRRDFWFWDKAEARNGVETYIFRYDFDSFAPNINPTLNSGKFRANLQGMTVSGCSPGHNAYFKFNNVKMGSIQWNGQNSVTFSKDIVYSFYSYHPDSVRWLQSGNYFEIAVDGNVCTTAKDDIIRINWFEFDHWRWNRVSGAYYNFKSPPNNFNDNLYYLWQWKSDNMKVYIPDRGEVIANPWIQNDADQSVYFIDTISQRTEYFCTSRDSFFVPDSIILDAGSDLRNVNNAADYIIITHPKFNEVAQRLAEFRTSNLPRIQNPRVKVVDVLDIYDEFSFGLLDPLALNRFVKFAFNNWVSPSPAYVVLLGDMSSDYRGIYLSSRPNYIPSIMIQAPEYGQAPSDNEIVCVAGDDIVPDLVIGRLSCETVEEGNILIDKIINYPADNGKIWKENVLLIASGLNAQDEAQFGFNDESLFLDDEYVIPNGFTSAKVFRYPNKPRHFPFQGEGPRIRQEFNRGAVLANYYGHGGGSQWDLVFTNDDIYQLNNEGRLPMIISVTCYTAHFDNQTIFGEIFNRLPGKGSIGFFGSSGLTWWQAGVFINKELFKEILQRRNYVFGNAVLKSKQTVPPTSFIGTQISLLTLLGDPAVELAFPNYPDFEIKSSDISIFPKNPLKDDSVTIFIKYRNLGVVFPNDSITIQVFENSENPENLIAEIKRGSFGQFDSVEVLWIPKTAGLFSIIVKVNEKDRIDEMDYSDNSASADFAVFSFGKPNIVRPVNGHFQSHDKVDFIFTDIGTFFGRNFSYVIEIDTSAQLNSSFKITSPILSQNEGIVKWKSPSLPQGEYYWRATIYDETDTNTSFLNTFSIINSQGQGYLSQKNHLRNFQTENMYYSEEIKSLVLNTDTLPPYPSNKRFLDSININLPTDANGITAFTTDGSYFYFGHLPYYTFGIKTKIYKIGTGLNNTIRGYNYGSINNLELNIKSQIFYHSDGFIYVATGDDSTLLKLDPNTGDTSRIYLPEKLLPTEDGLLRDSSFYVISDGNLIYNLSAGYGDRRNKYTMRIFNPSLDWEKVGDDIYFDGTSFRGFSGFMVVNGYLLVYESYLNGYMRRYRMADGFFEEEWLTSTPFKGYYTCAYDWSNNFVYMSTFVPGAAYKPGFHKFIGTYQDALGSATSEEIGPSVKWKNSTYYVDQTGSTGSYTVTLLGKNNVTNLWDTLAVNVSSYYSLENIDTLLYDYLKFKFDFVDSSYNPSAPLKLKSLLVNYDSYPEIVISSKDLTFSADTLLQGFPIDMELKVRNLGYATAENLNLKFYLNDADSTYFSDFITLPSDSVKVIKHTIPTSNLIFDNKFKVVAASAVPEFYTFNNITENGFFISRDSIKPFFSVTIDGREIVNGDIVSATPQILITLKDNSPLPLDTSLFTVIFDNVPLTFKRPDIEIIDIPYPNSELTINWKPKLKDGRHTLEVLAKDASGNFFDTTSSRTIFYVYNNPDLLYVYNYPNPFKNDTYFTFELRGSIVPDEFRIKIYTVAGRLIKELSIPSSAMNIGFNRVYWDGKDEDGDEIGNGIYFYKVISRLNEETKIITQKLAKVK